MTLRRGWSSRGASALHLLEGAAVLSLLGLFVVLGTAAAPYIAPAEKEVAAALIGAAGTIFAGWIAWVAVQRQIKTNAELDARREDATFNVIVAELRPLFDIWNLSWRTIDHALTQDQDAQQTGVVLVLNFCSTAAALTQVSSLEELGKDLDPVRRRRFVEVIHGVKAADRERERIVGERADLRAGRGDQSDPKFQLLGMRAQFSHLERYLRDFDPESANRLSAGRTKSKIEARSTAEQLVQMVAHFERTNDIG